MSNLIRNIKSIKGFTLIELLVVISIIGILVALSIFGLQGAREASRDARRKSDIEQIRSGLEIYKSDCNVYPATLGSSLIGDSSNPSASCDPSNTYIESVPVDPSTGNPYLYAPISVGGDNLKYRMCAKLEQDLPAIADCQSSGCATCNYKAVNP